MRPHLLKRFPSGQCLDASSFRDNGDWHAATGHAWISERRQPRPGDTGREPETEETAQEQRLPVMLESEDEVHCQPGARDMREVSEVSGKSPSGSLFRVSNVLPTRFIKKVPR